MNERYYEIKDQCRKGLLKHLEKVISALPEMENPRILDVGCGSGIPTLFLLENLGGEVTAIDSDAGAIACLRKKVTALNLLDRVSLSHCSLHDLETDDHFDLVIAEGVLHIVGFARGFSKILGLLCRKGFIIIHDELKNQSDKRKLIEQEDCQVLQSYVLDEQIWWHDYYKCLQRALDQYPGKDLATLFESDLRELEAIKKDSSAFRSIYYVVKRN